MGKFWIVLCAVFALFDVVEALSAATNGDTWRAAYYVFLTLAMVGCGYVNVRLDRAAKRRKAESKREADHLHNYMKNLKA